MGGLLHTFATQESVIMFGLSSPETLRRTTGQGATAVNGFIDRFIHENYDNRDKKMSAPGCPLHFQYTIKERQQ